MAWSAGHTIKRKGFSINKCTSQFQQSNLCYLQKIEDRFYEGYGSDGELVPLCDVEDLEYTQHFYEDSLRDVVPFDDFENTSDNEGNKSIAEGGDN